MKLKKILKGCGIIVAVFVLIIIGVLVYFIRSGISSYKEKEEDKLSHCIGTARDVTAELSKATGYINGHGYVDLGLSVKWATCNIGANSPSDYGNYYAWGETKPKKEYTEMTYVRPYQDEDIVSLCIAGDPTYDTARVNWGKKWRMPTDEEMQELIVSCHHEIARLGDYMGYIVTGPNGNSIFFPAAGHHDGVEMVGVGDMGCYWTSLFEDMVNYQGRCLCSRILFFTAHEFRSDISNYERGLPVRPVLE